jgi:hypothetical protein
MHAYLPPVLYSILHGEASCIISASLLGDFGDNSLLPSQIRWEDMQGMKGCMGIEV